MDDIFKGYINIQITSLKLNDLKLADYLDFNAFSDDISTSWITREMWAI